MFRSLDTTTKTKTQTSARSTSIRTISPFRGNFWVISSMDKLKFHWDQFPRNFTVANVTGKSPTSYEEVTKKLTTFRPSRHVDMVWRVANFLVTIVANLLRESGDIANKSARKLRGNWSQWNWSFMAYFIVFLFIVRITARSSACTLSKFARYFSL